MLSISQALGQSACQSSLPGGGTAELRPTGPEAATPHTIQHSLCDKMRENIQMEKGVCEPGSGLSHYAAHRIDPVQAKPVLFTAS